VNVSPRGPLNYTCECCPYLYNVDRKVRCSLLPSCPGCGCLALPSGLQDCCGLPLALGYALRGA